MAVTCSSARSVYEGQIYSFFIKLSVKNYIYYRGVLGESFCKDFHGEKTQVVWHVTPY